MNDCFFSLNIILFAQKFELSKHTTAIESKVIKN